MNSTTIDRIVTTLIAKGIVNPKRSKAAHEALTESLSDTLLNSWGVEDVFSLEERLTHLQSMSVLALADRYHDANVGVNWDVLRYHALQVRAVDKEPFDLADIDEIPECLQLVSGYFKSKISDKKKITFNVQHKIEEAIAVFHEVEQVGMIYENHGCNYSSKIVVSDCSSIEDLVDRYLGIDGLTTESCENVDSAMLSCLSSNVDYFKRFDVYN
jgi:hypothetical protein